MAKEPKTKEQFLNRMLMSDFSGDIRDLAADRNVTIKRASANVLDLTFGSGQHFQLVVRKPRSPEQMAAAEDKRQARLSGKSAPRKRKPSKGPDIGPQQH